MIMLNLKRLLRLALTLSGIFALFCVLSLAGALVWLRTSLAERFLTDLAVQTLAGQGLTLSVGGTSGPLPRHLLLRDVNLADAEGVFLHVDELEVALSLRQLLGGTLVVDFLRLSDPELFRLPVLPGKEESPPSQTSSSLELPVAIRLDNLRVENGRLYSKVLGIAENSAPGSLPAHLPEFLALNAEGAARFAHGIVTSRLAVASPKESAGGLGLAIKAAGTLDTIQGGLQSDFEITALDHAPWQLLLAQAAGLPADFGFGGSLALSGHISLPVLHNTPGATPELKLDAAQAAAEVVSGNLILQGKEMRWPPTLPAQALGDALSIKAGFSGGGAAPFAITLETLDLGILQASGKAIYAAGESGAAKVDKVEGPKDTVPGAETDNSLAPARLDAKAVLNISDLSPLEAGVAGALALELSANGSMDALKTLVTASSPELTLATGAVHEAALKVDADIRRQPGDGLNAAGTLETRGRLLLKDFTAKEPDDTTTEEKIQLEKPADVAEAFGELVELSTSWQVSLPGKISADASDGNPDAPQLTVAVSGLRAQGAGVELAGDLAARFNAESAAPHSSALPSVEGALSAEVKDWAHLSSLLALPLAGEQARADLRLENAAGRPRALLGLQLASLRLPGQGEKDAVSVRDIALTLDVQDLLDSQLAQLRLKFGLGSAGRMTWISGTGTLDGNLRDGKFSLQLQENFDKGIIKAAAAPKGRPCAPVKAPPVASRPGGLRDTLALRGSYELLKKEITLAQIVMEIPQVQTAMRLKKPMTVSFEKGLQVRGLDVAILPKGNFLVDADISAEAMTVKATVSQLPFEFFKMFTESPLPAGVINARAVVGTSSRGPQGTITLDSRMSLPATGDAQASTQFSPDQALSLQLEAILGRSPGTGGIGGTGGTGALALRGKGKIGVGKGQVDADRGDLNFSLPLVLSESGLPLPAMNAPLTAGVHWNGPAALLWQLAAVPDRFLTGRTLIKVAVSGSMSSPKIDAEAFLADGRYEDKVLGVLLEGVTCEARVTPAGHVRAALSLNDGQRGTVALEGRIFKDGPPTGGSAGQPWVTLRGQIRHLQPIHRDDLSIVFSGLFGINGSLVAPAITADVIVERGEVTLLSTMGGGSVETLNIMEKGAQAAEQGAGPSCAVTINIPGRFFIRGRGLDSEWEGRLRLNGPVAEPALTGSLRPVRGSFSLLSKAFEFTGGSITFFGGRPIVPGIDLELTYNGPNITAIVNVGGTSSRPTLALSSRPPLPQDEVLANVLFGKSVSSLSRFELLQLANSMRELAGVGESGFNPLTTMRKTLGLDVLRVGGGGGDQTRGDSGQTGASNIPRPGSSGATQSSSDQGPTIEAGRYITDSIYVGVEQGTTQESTGVHVEIELFPNVLLEGWSSTNSNQVGIGWSMDY